MQDILDKAQFETRESHPSLNLKGAYCVISVHNVIWQYKCK